MPPLKPKPSEIACEAKRTYLPYIAQRLPQFPSGSYFHADSNQLMISHAKRNHIPNTRLRVAVIDGDPVDVAIDWSEYETKFGENKNGSRDLVRIPIVNMANDKRPGGDWESGLLAPEENLCRRSNLYQCLTTPSGTQTPSYPLPLKGGIYSPYVGKF